MQTRSMQFVKRIPKENAYRWYRVSVQSDLFDDYVLIREWGRLGHRSRGQRHAEPFTDESAALQAFEAAVIKRLQRGYQIDS